MEIFNELSILVISYHLIAFTDYLSDSDIKEKVGWSALAFTLFNISVNMVIMMHQTYKLLKITYRSLERKIKAFFEDKKQKKHPTEQTNV